MNKLVAVAQLSVCFVLLLCISGSGQNRPAELVGQWICVDGETRYKPKILELFSDGTGVVDKTGVSWKVENKRFVILSPLSALSCNYKVSGYKLSLAYDDGERAIFVRRENLGEFRAEERAKQEAAKEKEDEEKRIAAEAERARIVNAKEDARRSIKTFVDSRNGKKYKQVTIGDVTWMAENLNYAINGSLCYGNKPENCEKYGRLYNWDASNKACPVGWRLPNENDWIKFIRTSGNSENFGTEIKSTDGWEENGNGTNVWGFSALPGGRYYTAMSNGISDPSNRLGDGFRLKGYVGWWWGYYRGGSYRHFIGAQYNTGRIDVEDVSNSWANNYYYSVRCVMCTEEERVKAEEERVKAEKEAEKEMENFKKTHIVDSRDGKKYKKVVIGKKTWMGENLNYDMTGSGCADYDADCEKYGHLYTWDAAMKACPAGTHLPSDEEWQTFETYFNGGKKHSAFGTSGQDIASAINNDGTFSIPSRSHTGRESVWWSSTEGNQKGNAKDAWMRGIYLCETCGNMDLWDKRKKKKTEFGSVRCVQD